MDNGKQTITNKSLYDASLSAEGDAGTIDAVTPSIAGTAAGESVRDLWRNGSLSRNDGL